MVSLVAAWLYLVGSVVGVGFTLNAFFPLRSKNALVPSFLASMLTIDLAAHHLVWQAIVGGGFVALGVLEHTVGRAALGLAAFSWLSLAYMVLRARTARSTMRATLDGFAKSVTGPKMPLANLFRAYAIRRREARCIRNVEYAKIAGQRLRLDVFLPRAEGKNRPAILQIHGGAWVLGDKRQQGVPLCTHLAANGWVAFNVNYRLSPGATFPDHLVDLKRALVWIREHAKEYGVDPSFVAVTGGSAGGHLTALVALTAGDPKYQPGFEDEDTSVQAAVPFYGVYDFKNRFGGFAPEFVDNLLRIHVMKADIADFPEKYAEASPIDRVHTGAPPFLVIHGDRDTLAPLKDAREFVKSLEAVSQSPVLYAEIRGAQHAFDVFASPRSAPVVEGVERFLHEVHRRHVAGEVAKPVQRLAPQDGPTEESESDMPAAEAAALGQ